MNGGNLMTKQEMLLIVNRLPNEDSKIVFEAEDIGEVPIASACVVGEGAEAKLILMEDFEAFEREVTSLGNDDDEVDEEQETGDDLYAFINAQVTVAPEPRVPEPLVKERQSEIAPLVNPSTF
jgi:hypothetical protein